MEFPVMFSRWKGGGAPAGAILLGADAVPTTTPPSTEDNVLASRFSNINGWPAHRIAVAYKPPSSPSGVTATMYLWENKSQRWYRIGAEDVVLDPYSITFFDNIGIPDLPNVTVNLDKMLGGSSQLMLVVKDGGAAPNGAHVFCMSADLTTLGY